MADTEREGEGRKARPYIRPFEKAEPERSQASYMDRELASGSELCAGLVLIVDLKYPI